MNLPPPALPPLHSWPSTTSGPPPSTLNSQPGDPSMSLYAAAPFTTNTASSASMTMPTPQWPPASVDGGTLNARYMPTHTNAGYQDGYAGVGASDGPSLYDPANAVMGDGQPYVTVATPSSNGMPTAAAGLYPSSCPLPPASSSTDCTASSCSFLPAMSSSAFASHAPLRPPRPLSIALPTQQQQQAFGESRGDAVCAVDTAAEEDAQSSTDHCITPRNEDAEGDGDAADAWRHSAPARLHLHPLMASAPRLGLDPISRATDPITAALIRQQQQLYRGEPRSPLSPRTLQALCSASVEGRQDSFLAALTMDEVLAPPPLALTWYPSVPPGVTMHADRKRRGDSWDTGNGQAEEEEEADVRERGGGVADERYCGGGSRSEKDESALPPLRRTRTDAGVAAAAMAPAPSVASAAVAPPDVGVPGHDAAPALDGSAVRGVTSRKRERGERVYEFISHGRRLN